MSEKKKSVEVIEKKESIKVGRQQGTMIDPEFIAEFRKMEAKSVKPGLKILEDLQYTKNIKQRELSNEEQAHLKEIDASVDAFLEKESTVLDDAMETMLVLEDSGFTTEAYEGLCEKEQMRLLARSLYYTPTDVVVSSIKNFFPYFSSELIYDSRKSIMLMNDLPRVFSVSQAIRNLAKAYLEEINDPSVGPQSPKKPEKDENIG